MIVPRVSMSDFVVGDTIQFSVYDDSGCGPGRGDAVEIELIGIICSISGEHAIVVHPYGECTTWLTIAKKVKLSLPEFRVLVSQIGY